jgi:hypothetical protein
VGVDDDDEARQARVALILAPAASKPGAAGATSAATALDAVAARALRAYAAAGEDAADGKLLKLLRQLLWSEAGAALAAAPLSAAPGEAELAGKLLALAKEARALEEEAANADVIELMGGSIDSYMLEAAASDVALMTQLARGPLGVEAGAAVVITNGRVIPDWSPRAGGGAAGGGGGVGALTGLTAEDFGLMQMYAQDIQAGELESSRGLGCALRMSPESAWWASTLL